MNRNQWFVLGIGSIIFSSLMFKFASGICSIYEGDIMVACTIRRYAFSIPAITGQFLGWICITCGFLESKKK